MKLILSVDTEGDFWRYIQAPFGSLSKIYKIKWHLNKIRGFFSYAPNRQGLVNIVNFLKENNIPATFNITGHLYLKSCSGWPHFNELKPKASWFFKKDWYYWDKEGDFNSKPGFYIGDFIEKEMKHCKLFDLGIHGFAHECLPLENQRISDSNIQASTKAAKKLGITPVSASAPFNITEDKKSSSNLYNSLKKNGIKVVRYMGWEDYPKGYNHQFKVIPPFKKSGLTLVNGSNYFEGTSSKQHLRRILANIKENLWNENAVYCLCCHDFTFKSLRNMEIIFKEILKWKKENKIKLMNMRGIF